MKTNVLVVSITKLYDRNVQQNGRRPTGDELYDMARWAWRSRDAESCQLVFACVHGKIEGVFEVQEWFSCGTAKKRPELRPNVLEGSLRYKEIEKDIKLNRRMAFVGRVADCANQYIGQDAPRLRGPIGYTTVNC